MRLYGFVMYNLSGIQKGIQFGHAALEYTRKYPNKRTTDFIDNHKTFIVLSGGGSNDMLNRQDELKELDVKHAVFHEPDLNGAMSAIVFIVDEEDYSPTGVPSRLNAYLKKFSLA